MPTAESDLTLDDYYCVHVRRFGALGIEELSWRAIFLDGPLQGPEHDCLLFGDWQADLYFAPSGLVLPAGNGWLLVGTGRDKPSDGWSRVLHYVRNDERSSLIKDDDWEPGTDEGFAAYELAPEPE